MKRIFSLTLCLCLVLILLTAFALPCFAEDGMPLTVTSQPGSGSGSGNPLVVDNAGLLSSGEREALERKARSISDAHGCEVIILTVNDAGWKSAQEYAEDYYVEHDYGFGTDRSGIMLFLDMGERDYHLATRGMAISAFPDNTLLFLESRFLPDLSGGDYAEAFETYLDYSDKILGVADNSLSQSEYEQLNAEYNAYMNGDQVQRKPNYVRKGILSVILGALGGLIPAGVQKSSLKTVRKKRDAAGYAQEGSLNLTVNRDTYLYSNVTSHVIQRTESSGGGHNIGTGHSSTHTHSSGATFGGHGGKF